MSSVDAAARPRRAWVEHIMGTAMSVHVIGADAADRAIEDAVAACFAHLRQMDAMFSPYRADSDISLIRAGAQTLADADARVKTVARACERFEAATGGLFSAYIQGWFDPTGYVKGWAVEEAANRHLAPLVGHTGIVAVGINAGGDLRLFTRPGADWSWRVGIADPRHSGAVIATVDVTNGAVATSGTAERGAHIVDPRTGVAATETVSATVIADDLITADVWATAAVVSGVDDLTWITRAPTRTGMVFGADGRSRRWLRSVEVSVVSADESLL